MTNNCHKSSNNYNGSLSITVRDKLSFVASFVYGVCAVLELGSLGASLPLELRVDKVVIKETPHFVISVVTLNHRVVLLSLPCAATLGTSNIVTWTFWGKEV